MNTSFNWTFGVPNGDVGGGGGEKLPQCDYTQLFSHLPLSFQFISQQTANLQLQIQTAASSYSTLSPPSLSSSSSTTTPPQLLTASSLELLQAQYQQRSAYKLCFALVSLLFGLFYSLIGYRFLKLSTFFIGFTLGTSVIYLILAEQKQLTLVETLIIALSIGVLFAFVSLLVQYIGLFLLGITASTSVVTCILIVIDLFYTNKSAWLCIGLLFVCATVLASFSLKFQKALTIVNTSCIGCALLLVAVDFFVENNLLVDYIMELFKVNGNSFNVFERQKALLKSSSDFTTTTSTIQTANVSTSTFSSTSRIVMLTTSKSNNISSINRNSQSFNGTSLNGGSGSGSGGSGALALFLHLYSSAHARLCWYTWLIFGSYFVMLFVSLLVQFLLTGKNYDHRDSWHKLIRGSRKKKSANLEKIRLKSHLNDHHHHHHHHHNHGSTTISSSNNLDLISGAESSSSLSRHSDLESSCQNDTLLLVESKKSHIQNYTVNEKSVANGNNGGASSSSSASSSSAILNKNHNNNKRSGKHSRRAHHSRKPSSSPRRHQLECCDSENANSSTEIISFEVLNQNKKEKSKSKSKSKPKYDSKPANHSNVEKETKLTKSALSSPPPPIPPTAATSASAAAAAASTILTTTSTNSTTSSSASSTCHLIPLKLNNIVLKDKDNDDDDEDPPPKYNQTSKQPSAPPCPQLLLLTSSPPPPAVPSSLPPPKLPNLIASLSTAVNSLTNASSSSGVTTTTTVSTNLAMPSNNITKNLSKIKNHNRMSSKDKDAKADDRFRHFYQVRRNNGDVLSQDFMNNIQSKLSSSSNLNSNSNLTLNPLETNQSSTHASRSASLNSKENTASKSNGKRKKTPKKL